MVGTELGSGTSADEMELKTIKSKEVPEVLNFLRYLTKGFNKDYFDEDNNELRFLENILKDSIELNENEDITGLIIYLAMSIDEIIKN